MDKTIFPCWQNGVKSYTAGGRVQCDVCESFKGVYAKNYRRKDNAGNTFLKLFTTCVNCGSKEIKNNYTGEILKQIRNLKHQNTIIIENLLQQEQDQCKK